MDVSIGSRAVALLRLFLAALILAGPARVGAEPVSLGAFGADLSKTSVSGLSSGAFMTSQFYVVHSKTMVGAGIVAGGPYFCSGSWAANTLVENATTTCMNPLTESVGPNVPFLVEKAEAFAEAGLIDPLDNLTDDRIYLFSGRSDRVVTSTVVDATRTFFVSVGVPEENILYRMGVEAGHAIITDNDDDTRCARTESPFINNCGFEQSHEILEHIYGELNPPADTLSGEIVEFWQKDFIESSTTSMSDSAFLYVPESCNSNPCRVHVVFHGCQQGAKVIGNEYYETTGYNEVADTNGILVLYPQVQPSESSPLNPQGCWDFWGYSSPGDPDPDFYSRNAPQISAVMRMLQRLGEPTDR